MNDTAIADLLDEVGEKNRVRVVVHRGRHGRNDCCRTHHKTYDELAESFPHPAMAMVQDEVRMLAGLKPIFLPEAIRRTGGELVGVFANERTNVGKDYVANSLGKSSSRPAVADYIALSSNTTALPQATNTSVSTPLWGTATAGGTSSSSVGEITALGLSRAQASSYSHTTGTTLYSLSKTFTASGTVTLVQWAGMFNAATQGTGTLFLQNKFSATTLANTDQITITWTVNV